MRSLGIDVGVGKGLDLVLMDERRTPAVVRSRASLDDVEHVIREFAPEIVAVDSPPKWARGGRSRHTENELARLNIHAFRTPSEEHADHPRFEWMRRGMEVFALSDQLGYPLATGRPYRKRAIEVFPHATATVLAGCLPPRGERKRQWRERVLKLQGVRTEELTTVDRLDAALAALTGLLVLDGHETHLGDPSEGVIVDSDVGAGPHVPPGHRRARGPGPALRLVRVRGTGLRPAGPRRQRIRPRTRREAQVPAVAPSAGGRHRTRGTDAARVGAPAGGRPVNEEHIETEAIHAGQEPEGLFGAVNVPIYQTSTYAQDAVGSFKRWDYGRGGNPTREALETALAAMEGGARAFAFASGLAAEATLLLTLRPGDHVVLADDVYGGTYRLITNVLGPWGLACDTADTSRIRRRSRPP